MSRLFVVILLSTSFIFSSLHAQDCNGENLIPYGDFGSGVPNVGPRPNWYPNDLLGYMAAPPPPDGNPETNSNPNGEFTIAKFVDIRQVEDGGWGGFASLFWWEARENSNDPNGYMMVVNPSDVEGTNVVIWREQVELCGSAVYEFSVDIINIFDPNNTAPSIYEPNLSFRINGQTVENYNNGVIPRDGNWYTYTTTINPPNGSGTYTIDLFHISESNGSRIFGGDFAIDNLGLRKCQPELSLPSQIVVCQPNQTQINAAINNMVFANPVYQWQISRDNGNSWQNIPNSNTTSLFVDNPNDGDQYRIMVAQDAASLSVDVCQVISNPATLEVRVTRETINRTICEGKQFQIGNQVYTETGTFQAPPIRNAAGCDSLVTLNLTVLPNATSSLEAAICDGETYDFLGNLLTTAGTYQETIMAQNGCDSVITLELAIRESIEATTVASICEGETYTFEGQNLTTSGSYPFNYQTASGCDSILTLELTVLEHTEGVRNVPLCEGETFEGTVYTESTTFQTVLTNAVGCDSTLTTNILVSPIFENTIPTQVCEGETFLDLVINSDTTIILNQTSINGCDSITNYQVELLRPVVVNLEQQICTGESFLFAGEDRTETNQYIEVLTAANGCDSTTILDLQVLQSIEISQAESICEGESYEFEGQTLTIADIYTATYQTTSGCDSTITLELTVLEHTEGERNIALCEGEMFEGTAYTESTTFQTVLTNAVGCDSTLTTNILVSPVFENTIPTQVCEGETFLDLVINSDTTIILNQTSVNGCDSITNYQVELLRPVVVNLEQQICTGESFLFAGEARTETNQYIEVLTAANGCDSTTILDLQVLQSIEISQAESICEGESYEFEGQTLTIADIYTATYQTTSGCDSTITLELTVLEHTEGERNIALCEGEMFEGTAYTESTTFQTILENAVGCDSTLTTNITVSPVFENTIPTQVCEGETFLDLVINSDTTIILNQTSVNGCDSITNYEVEMLRPVVVTLERQICENETFEFDGLLLNETGQYTQTITGSNSCDSTTILNLQVLQVIETSLEGTVCRGETYEFGNQMLSEAGIYIDSLVTATGCDSVVTLNLAVLETSENTIDVNLCAGEMYLGQVYTESTILTDELINGVGCDSILTTNVIVAPIYEQTELVDLCRGDFFIGSNRFSDTTFAILYQSMEGCDSLVNYELAIEDLSDFEIEGDISLCPDESSLLSAGNFASYEWNSGESTSAVEITTTGWYAVTVTSDLGCIASDSVLVEVTALSAELATQPPRCFGESNGSISVVNINGGTPPYEYRLNDGAAQAQATFARLEAGFYELEIVDAAGCSLNLSEALTEPDLLEVNIGETLELSLGATAQLNATSNRPVQYNWSPESIFSCTDCPNPIVSPVASQNVIITVVDSMGCEATDQLSLIVGNYKLYAPNAFSPNGDGVNDIFQIFPNNGVASVDYFRIYDRWGNQLLEKVNPELRALTWDGTAGNQTLNPSKYTWMISLELIDGRSEILTGEVLVK